MSLVVPSHENSEHAAGLDAELSGTPEYERVTKAIQRYLEGSIATPSELANFADTPVRATKAHRATRAYSCACGVDLRIIPKTEVLSQAASVLATGFPMEADAHDAGIVVQGPVEARGMCPHHLLPVHYAAYVAYQPAPGGTVLGLSKLSRLVRLLANRPVLQEQVSADIADALFFSADAPRGALPQIASAGSAVQLIGWHSCMASRGVQSLSPTLTTALRGSFRDPSLKAEFYQAVQDLPKFDASTVPDYIVDPSKA